MSRPARALPLLAAGAPLLTRLGLATAVVALVGDCCSGAVSMLDSAGKSHPPRLGLDTDSGISSLGEDPRGQICVLDYGKAKAFHRLEGNAAG